MLWILSDLLVVVIFGLGVWLCGLVDEFLLIDVGYFWGGIVCFIVWVLLVFVDCFLGVCWWVGVVLILWMGLFGLGC